MGLMTMLGEPEGPICLKLRHFCATLLHVSIFMTWGRGPRLMPIPESGYRQRLLSNC